MVPFLVVDSQSLEELPAGSVAKEVVYMSVCSEPAGIKINGWPYRMEVILAVSVAMLSSISPVRAVDLGLAPSASVA